MTVSKKTRSLARKASSRCMTCLGGKPEMWRCGAETVDGEWNLCDFGGMYGSFLWFFSVRNRWDLDLMVFSMETMISLGFCKISSKSWSPKAGAVAINGPICGGSWQRDCYSPTIQCEGHICDICTMSLERIWRRRSLKSAIGAEHSS